MKKTAIVIFATMLTGCSLYSNTDRQNFNSRAVIQPQTAISPCALQIGNALHIMCIDSGTDENSSTTIVRVSR